MRKYEWREGTRCGTSAATFGKTIDQIRGPVTAETVVEVATPKGSPIHDMFTWDNAKAAHEHRLSEARRHLRCLRVVVEYDTKPKVVIARIHIGQGRYVPPETVAKVKEYKEHALEEAQRQLRGLRRRYAFLGELDKVWKAIDELPAKATKAAVASR